ncbi:hypothetical protein [Nocardioides jensenii]|uniref:hypothetical protein n=1 Tax=Nocardioides jensenii TaxID=1843 RepID=UPI0012FB3A95|nr:hypothetical protein [Nocardioides jensenii]
MGADGRVPMADASQAGGIRWSTTGRLEGTGSPGAGSNATLTDAAPVGTEYVDTAGTNGAWKWIKTSAGPGISKWAVTVGDTGWRDITALLGADFTGFVLVRRNTNLVDLRITQLRRSAGTSTTPITTLPTAFQSSSVPVYGRTYWNFQCYVAAATIAVTAYTGGGDYWAVCFSTGNAWPTSLPGNAA